MRDHRHDGAVRALLLMRIFRVAILVASAAGAAAAWGLGSPTGLALALVIAAEEMWETSVVIGALRHQLAGTPLPGHRV